MSAFGPSGSKASAFLSTWLAGMTDQPPNRAAVLDSEILLPGVRTPGR
jgi:hypothetical protein